MSRQQWTFGTFTSLSNGLGVSSEVRMAGLGLRVGRVLNSPFGRGALRGTVEASSEVYPFERFYWHGHAEANGFAFNPVVLKWNFVGLQRRRTLPYAVIVGGLIATDHAIPPGDTSEINFRTGIGGGAHFFVRPRRAITVDTRVVHISNASLGNHNPGVNASMQVTLGYTWFAN